MSSATPTGQALAYVYSRETGAEALQAKGTADELLGKESRSSDERGDLVTFFGR
jgi:hypothetical protein